MESYIRYYPPDVFPSLWEKLDELIEKGELAATEEVLIELGKKDDDVYKWAKDREFMFVPLTRIIHKMSTAGQGLLVDDQEDEWLSCLLRRYFHDLPPWRALQVGLR